MKAGIASCAVVVWLVAATGCNSGSQQAAPTGASPAARSSTKTSTQVSPAASANATPAGASTQTSTQSSTQVADQQIADQAAAAVDSSTATSNTIGGATTFLKSCLTYYAGQLEGCDNLYGAAGAAIPSDFCAVPPGETADAQERLEQSAQTCPTANVRASCPRATLAPGYEAAYVIYTVAPAYYTCEGTDGADGLPGTAN